MPDLGTTGAMVDTGVARDIGAAATDATAGAMSAEGNMHMAAMIAAMGARDMAVDIPAIIMLEAATGTPTLEVTDSMAEVPSAVAEVDSTEADTGNYPLQA